MKLVFIQPLGTNYLGEIIYEFLFTSKDEMEGGDDWSTLPASSGAVTPPPVDEIEVVGTLKSTLEFDLAMTSDYFSFNDCVEKIVALAWQTNHKDFEERVVFRFEDTLEEVEKKLYAKDLKLSLQKIK